MKMRQGCGVGGKYVRMGKEGNRGERFRLQRGIGTRIQGKWIGTGQGSGNREEGKNGLILSGPLDHRKRDVPV